MDDFESLFDDDVAAAQLESLVPFVEEQRQENILSCLELSSHLATLLHIKKKRCPKLALRFWAWNHST
eukprot:6459744-Amphidinium_carterae.2